MITVITGVSAHAEAQLATALGSARSVDLVRRCADLAEVMAVSAAGRAQVALVSVELPGLDRSALRELAGHGVRVVGVYGDESQEAKLRKWGVGWLIAERAGDDELLEQVRQAAESAQPVGHSSAPSTDPAATAMPEPPEPNDQDEPGKVLAIWGTGGAPGRSVLAAGLAVEFASAGESTLLIDADTYAAAQAQLFGILDEAPGIAAAARLAEAGRLDPVSLAGVAPLIGDRLRILTGLPRADRWPEIRTAALEVILDAARRTHRWTVVDIAAPTDLDEELSYDTSAPQRNMATRTVLQMADEVFVVGAGDPVGLSRLVQSLDQLAELTPAPRTVVVSKVRASAAGRNPEAQIQDALQRFSGVTPVLLPDDRDALDAALLTGRAITDASPGSPLSQAVREIANGQLGLPPGRNPASRRRRLLRRHR